jgi:isopentenyl diphosphate isomerase/L-lactate dehydrogenase-like FMN-dependent dehydrogenase
VAVFRYRLRAPERLISVEDYRRAAGRRLPPMVWSFVDGGADDLVTLRENQAAFGRWRLRSRVLTGHGERDLSTTVAGIDLRLPVLLAPTGSVGLSHWRGDIAAAHAAERAGTRHMLSTMSSWSLEEVAGATAENHVFQLYPREGDLAARLMRRAWDAGYRVLVLTVDVPIRGNREGERRHGMDYPPVLTPWGALQFARHPRWLSRLLRHRRFGGRNLVEGVGMRAALQGFEVQERQLMQSTLSWDDLAWMRERWRGRLLVKGILEADDARRAVDLGVDGIMVSNHGGRQLDTVPAALDALPDIVAAVGDRAEVLLDGGVRRGTDVLKALALGARAVAIGRPYVYGLAVAGERGVSDVLEIFRAEIERAMILMGVRSVREVDRSWILPAPPP